MIATLVGENVFTIDRRNTSSTVSTHHLDGWKDYTNIDLSYSPDGSKIMVASANQKIKVLDSNTLADKLEITAFNNSTGMPLFPCFSSDSSYVVWICLVYLF